MKKTDQKVFVGMSGGVDSSVAAALLKAEGYQVTGIHLRCYNVDGCAETDAEDARRAAEALKIPFYVLDFEKEYKAKVVEYMVAGYKSGETPNPDVMCNKEIKFGLFYQAALELGADFIATGHYVKLIKRKPARLFTARDKNKDQSYFLWTLTQEQLQHCLFPIGEHVKPEVRRLAKKFGLPNAAKKDSQGICFLGRVSLPEFLGRYIKPRAGSILSKNGEVLGTHHGVQFYTIGQRQGLGVGGTSKPLYVAKKDIKKNTLTVVEGKDHPELFQKEVILTDLNFISSPTSFSRTSRPKASISVMARLRYRQPLAKAILRMTGRNSAKLIFESPQKFVAPGQSAVFYSKSGEMLGGGVII